jgi:hypothetical protein
MQLAPIVLFVYNRPSHTLKTLEALQTNELAGQSVLYIYADGPKEGASMDEVQKIAETRRVVKSKQWCKEVILIEQQSNKGLADSIIIGVTEVVNKHGKIIVLEDDIVTSKGFLKYINDALTFYEEETKVMHVSGYMFPIRSSLPATFFYNSNSCWGWGTWQRAWRYFNNDAQYLLSALDDGQLKNKFNIDGGYDFYDHLKANVDGRLKTWAVKWYASFFLQNGLALHPYPSLVNNIGQDGTGEHGDMSAEFLWKELAGSVAVKKIRLTENGRARKLVATFYKKQSVSPKVNFFLGTREKAKELLSYIVPKTVKHRYKKSKKR